MSNSRYIKTVIDNQEVTFENDEGFPLSLVYAVEAVEDVTKLTGYHTRRSVSIVGDKAAREVFERWEDGNEENNSGASEKDAFVEVDGLPILWGKAKLRKVKLSGDRYYRRGETYLVDLYGNNINWFRTIKDKRLRDYAGAFPDVTFNALNIFIGADTDYTTQDWGFCLIKWREWESPDEIKYHEHTPFIFVKSFLREIFRDLGYQIIGDFIDEEYFERLIMPIPLLNGYPKEFYIDETDLRTENTGTYSIVNPGTGTTYDPFPFDDDSTDPNFDNGDNFDLVTEKYIIPYAGAYIVSFRCKANIISPAPYDVDIRLEIRLDGIVQNYKDYTIQNPENGVEMSLVYPYDFTTSDVGSEINVSLYVYTDLATLSLDITDATLEIEADLGIGRIGVPIIFDYLIPDKWKASDFIIGLKQAFNLVFDTKIEEGTVRIEPKDPYFLKYINGAGSQISFSGDGYYKDDDLVEWTAKVDLSQEATVVPVDNGFDELIIGWRQDDETVKGLDTDQLLGVYDGKYLFDSTRHKKGDKTERNKFFAKTLHLIDPAIRNPLSIKDPQVPLIFPYDYLSNDNPWITGDDDDIEHDLEAARLLWFAGKRGEVDGYVNIEGTSVPYDYPFAFFVNYNDETGFDVSLSFCDETLINGDTVQGLLKRFYAQDLTRRNVGKILDESIFLGVTDILALDFRNKVLINGDKYILRMIDGYNPTTGESTKTTLLIDAIQEDLSDYEDSKLKGYIAE